ncbi:Arrestin domain-containing protein 3 [Frankliniella fusca]|uniref:Arrestin domain-containing protein 3 n=1 Tax=Frankliniella fusca TaxID=407009 RepID=A0AAE1LA15_9NEOP|nr:Arrestin domain-containing protein 3 [Frankliniella fusca]
MATGALTIRIGIALDRPQSVYYAGETLSGRVQVRVNEPTKVKYVKIFFSGEALVRRQFRPKTVLLYIIMPLQRQVYLDREGYLLGSDSGEEALLSPGEHEYPFECALPQALPSSFTGSLGHIRYTVRAAMRPSTGREESLKLAYTVIQPLDLNTLPQIAIRFDFHALHCHQEPIDKKNSKHFWCLCCSSGPLSMSLQVPKRGFVPGETIPFYLQVSNNAGSYVVRDVMVKLLQRVAWHANCEKSFEVNVVGIKELADSCVEGSDSRSFSDEVFVKPVPPAVSKDQCDLLSYEYILRAVARVQGPHLNLVISAPIVIGTTPLALQ